MSVEQPGYFFSAWQDYEDWLSRCPDCTWEGVLREAIFEWETDMVSCLRCPNCKNKLALLNNEASREEIVSFAEQGSKKALRYLKSNS